MSSGERGEKGGRGGHAHPRVAFIPGPGGAPAGRGPGGGQRICPPPGPCRSARSHCCCPVARLQWPGSWAALARGCGDSSEPRPGRLSAVGPVAAFSSDASRRVLGQVNTVPGCWDVGLQKPAPPPALWRRGPGLPAAAGAAWRAGGAPASGDVGRPCVSDISVGSARAVWGGPAFRVGEDGGHEASYRGPVCPSADHEGIRELGPAAGAALVSSGARAFPGQSPACGASV